MRADSADGEYTNIADATDSTYEVQASDKFIKVKFTATGSYTGTKESDFIIAGKQVTLSIRGNGPATGHDGDDFDYAAEYIAAGITFDAATNTITLDEATFDAYLAANPANIEKLRNGDRLYVGLAYAPPGEATYVMIGNNEASYSLSENGSFVHGNTYIGYFSFAEVITDGEETTYVAMDSKEYAQKTISWSKNDEDLGIEIRNVSFVKVTPQEKAMAAIQPVWTLGDIEVVADETELPEGVAEGDYKVSLTTAYDPVLNDYAKTRTVTTFITVPQGVTIYYPSWSTDNELTWETGNSGDTVVYGMVGHPLSADNVVGTGVVYAKTDLAAGAEVGFTIKLVDAEWENIVYGEETLTGIIPDPSKTVVTNKAELEAALTNADVTEITVEGNIGGEDAYTIYNVSRKVTIQGANGAKVYGTFIVKADDVTINNLAIQNKGDLDGESTTNRGGIYVFAENVTLNNNTITNGLGENAGLSNAIQIMSPKADNPLSNYTITGNKLIGHIQGVPNWSSSGIVIAQGYKPGSIGQDVLSITATESDYQNLLSNNTFTNNAINLTHQDWTTGLEGGPVLYPYAITGLTISGEAKVGGTLTATIEPEAATATYQWQRSDTADGEWTAIDGATSSTYVLTQDDAGKHINVRADGKGHYDATYWWTSASTAAIVDPNETLSFYGNAFGENDFGGRFDGKNTNLNKRYGGYRTDFVITSSAFGNIANIDIEYFDDENILLSKVSATEKLVNQFNTALAENNSKDSSGTADVFNKRESTSWTQTNWPVDKKLTAPTKVIVTVTYVDGITAVQESNELADSHLQATKSYIEKRIEAEEALKTAITKVKDAYTLNGDNLKEQVKTDIENEDITVTVEPKEGSQRKVILTVNAKIAAWDNSEYALEFSDSKTVTVNSEQ